MSAPETMNSPEAQRPSSGWLERWGSRFLTTESTSQDERIEVLTPEEQRELSRIERAAIFRAAMAGALSAGVSSAFAIFCVSPEVDPLRHYLWLGGATLLASVVEIGFLYFDALRATRAMSAASGLVLRLEEDAEALRRSLSRAALELPSPPENHLRVDPYLESSRLGLLLVGLVYKAKIALTTFVLKVVMRKALGRAVARSYLELIGIPVTALWNAWIAARVLAEARLRIVGPSAAAWLGRWVAPSGNAGQLIAVSIAQTIITERVAHPNVDALARSLFASGTGVPAAGRREIFLGRLSTASENEAAGSLKALCAAAVLDGYISRRELALLTSAFLSRGLGAPIGELCAIAYHLRKGDGLRFDLIEALEPYFTRETPA